MKEWKKLKWLQEMVDVCQIPEDILGSMTTEALIETVVNYTLFINVFAYDNNKTGLEHVKGYFTVYKSYMSEMTLLKKWKFILAKILKI